MVCIRPGRSQIESGFLFEPEKPVSIWTCGLLPTSSCDKEHRDIGRADENMTTPLALTTFGQETPQIFLYALLMVCVLSLRASASLGGDVDSVQRDGQHVNGSERVTNAERYTIYEIKISTGTSVREFISPAGIVFGVAWEGPIVPELQQFLGAYFKKYSEAVQAQKSRYASRRPLHIHLPDLVFENGGHMGAYYGRAYIPQNVPEKVRTEEIY